MGTSVMRLRFEDMTNPRQIREYLKRVLDRPGMKKDEAMLYHYTSIKAVTSILDSGYIWLGSTANMNDYLENECLKPISSQLFLTSFSKAEENMGMYKMYAQDPNGVIMKISFAAAEQIIKEIPRSTTGEQIVRIVRDNTLMDNQVEADLYWTAVCYKHLHSDMIIADSVKNLKIKHPLDEPELAGYIKLYGWEYEKEVRLCARTKTALAENEKVAVKLPDEIKISIILGPGFDKVANRSDYAKLFRKGINVQSSAYEAWVNLSNKENKMLDPITDEEFEAIIYNKDSYERLNETEKN